MGRVGAGGTGGNEVKTIEQKKSNGGAGGGGGEDNEVQKKTNSVTLFYLQKCTWGLTTQRETIWWEKKEKEKQL